MSFQLDASVPGAAKVNPEITQAQILSIPANYRQFIMSYGGGSDPMSGKMIPGTDIEWDKSTEVQSLIWEAVSEGGTPPTNLQEILDANPGPKEFWNLSYEGAGLVPGVAADPIVDIKSTMSVKDGTVSRQIILPS